MCHSRKSTNSTSDASTGVEKSSRWLPPRDQTQDPLCRPIVEQSEGLSVVGWVLVGLVRGYQWLLSPLVGNSCRFYPSCSNYYILSVYKYGSWRGHWRGVWRVLRCQPLGNAGDDFP